jgi:O-antigen ligase
LLLFRPKNSPINFFFKKELYFFLFIVILTSVLRENLGDSLRNAAAILLTYGIVIILSIIMHSIPFKLVIKTLVVTLISFIPFMIYTHVSNVGPLVVLPDRSANNNYRLGGIFYYAHTAMLLGVLALLSLSYAIEERRKKYFLIYTISLVLIAYTDTRSVWLASAAITGYIFYNSFFKKRINPVIILFIALPFYILYHYLSSADNSQVASEDLNFRSQIWAYAMIGIFKNPFFGYGSESFLAKDAVASSLIDGLSDPHSSFLAITLQSGLLGLIAFIILYTKIFYHFKKFSHSSFKNYYSLFIFWIIAPFFWGYIYNGTAGFITTFFPITIIGILCHPQIYMNKYNV